MLPSLTDEQRRTALDKAMQIRTQQANICRCLKRGKIGIDDFFMLADNGAEAASSMRVAKLVAAMPGYGFAKTRQLMARLAISERRRVRGLGPKQRAKLLAHFNRRD